jgi:hypothetical protein
MQVGFTTEELFPRRGKEIHFTVNGTKRMARGNEGESAVVKMNGNQVGMNTPLEPNCFIEIEPSTVGTEAVYTIEQLDEYASSTVTFVVNNKRVICPKFVEVNGSLEPGSYQIQEGDDIETRSYYTVGQLAEFMDVELDSDRAIMVNNRPATLDSLIYENFEIEWTTLGFGAADVEKAGEVADAEGNSEDADESGNAAEGNGENAGDTAADGEKTPEQMLSGRVIHVKANGEDITLSGKNDYMFVDIFTVIDFDIHAGGGRNVVTKINGEPCGYTAPLNDGDSADVYWEE